MGAGHEGRADRARVQGRTRGRSSGAFKVLSSFALLLPTPHAPRVLCRTGLM